MSTSAASDNPPAEAPSDPYAPVRTRGYLGLLVITAALGVPVSAAAFGFLALVSKLQKLTYTDLPKGLGFDGTPSWWPVPLLAVSGLLVGLVIRGLPGEGGHRPAQGLSAGGAPTARELPGIALAAIAALSLGAVLGPEAPLIALGGGLAVCAARLLKPDLPRNAAAIVGAAGSFAAISTLLGSPLTGAFLLMEVSTVGGAMLGVVLVPGLLAAGIGALFFTGLGDWTGLGTYSLAIHGAPHADTPDAAGFGWAVVIGLAAALVGAGIRWAALRLETRVAGRRLLGTAAAGVAVGLAALIYAEGSGHNASEILYSGQDALGPLLTNHEKYTVGALLLLIVCKAAGYCLSLAAFRGGPVFPSLFVGATGGLLLTHAPGLDTTAGFAMGIGAMATAMLRLPMTSVLLATLLLGADGLTVMPLVIVAVVVSYVASLRLTPRPEAAAAAAAASPPPREPSRPSPGR
ncbi:chloride channel protein [Yinghuangia sp. ASG 101]|uniref:chloride channel protein n=1 Tax=Yinghuangia sp. ASG 101 TaxID=2896848 RepID=UPI001E611248|nr:chloride channel protein [Yinghuangia sp. ASG 101]UGQ12001.1 chloride channel protein [Yinghuangia sp. ASG 101]